MKGIVLPARAMNGACVWLIGERRRQLYDSVAQSSVRLVSSGWCAENFEVRANGMQLASYRA